MSRLQFQTQKFNVSARIIPDTRLLLGKGSANKEVYCWEQKLNVTNKCS